MSEHVVRLGIYARRDNCFLIPPERGTWPPQGGAVAGFTWQYFTAALREIGRTFF